MVKSLLAGAAFDTVPCGKWGVQEAEKAPGQIPGCPQVLSGRWVGDDRSFSWCQQPGIAGKGSSCQEKPHNLHHRRNPQQKRKVFAGSSYSVSSSGRMDVSSFFFKQLVNN